MPPGAKKSWRLGRFSGGAGVIEMGAEVDKLDLRAILAHADDAISIIEKIAKI
jgi:hypothetical protein